MKNELRSKLESVGQQHLLDYWDELSGRERKILGAQILQINFDELARLTSKRQEHMDYRSMAARAEPPRAVRADGTGARWSLDNAIDRGVDAIIDGQIGMILVAGGQGSRLGYDKPKGMFPIGPLSGRSLFQMHADRLLAVSNRYGTPIPLYVMTSPATHEATIDYIASKKNFGLQDKQLQVFCQGTMPAVDAESGRVLMESKYEVALSPDGHGGTISAFAKSGCLDDATQRGVEHICYAQIDNPLANPYDPALIGHHLLAESDMTTQVVRKRDAAERVGNVVLADGKVQIIEYIDLPEDVAQQTLDDGSLKLWAGNIAIHLFRRAFLENAVSGAEQLPFHLALKKVAHIDSRGQLTEPASPNATKFERFIFDLLPIAKNAIVVEGAASEIFAPVKNADGAATDTPESSKQAISDLHRSWLQDAGASIAEGVTVEIHPSWAENTEEVADRVDDSLTIDADHYFAPNPDDDRLTIVTRCNSAIEAELMQAQMGSAGIQSFLQGTHSNITLGVGAPSRGIPVFVRERDLPRAQSFLSPRT